MSNNIINNRNESDRKSNQNSTNYATKARMPNSADDRPGLSFCGEGVNGDGSRVADMRFAATVAGDAGAVFRATSDANEGKTSKLQ
jgi:hypothetical protein